MSRIGKLPIHVPAGVTVTIKDNVVTVKGPKGELVQEVNPDINVTLEDGVIHLTRPTNSSSFLYPSEQPTTMLLIKERYKPCFKYRSVIGSFFRLYSQYLFAVAEGSES